MTLVPAHLGVQLRDRGRRLRVVHLPVGRRVDDGRQRAVERLVEGEEAEGVGRAVREPAGRAGRGRRHDRAADARAVGLAGRRLRPLLGHEHVARDVVIGRRGRPAQVDAGVVRSRGEPLGRRRRDLVAGGDAHRAAGERRVARGVDREHGVAVELAVERGRVRARGRRALAGRVAVGDRRRRGRGQRPAHDVARDAGAGAVTRGDPADVDGAVERRAGRDAARCRGRRRVVRHRDCAGGDAERGVADRGGDHLVGVGAVGQAHGRVGERGRGCEHDADGGRAAVAEDVVVVERERHGGRRGPAHLRALVGRRCGRGDRPRGGECRRVEHDQARGRLRGGGCPTCRRRRPGRSTCSARPPERSTGPPRRSRCRGRRRCRRSARR